VVNIFDRQINGHRGRGKPKKTHLEDMTRQDGCVRYSDMNRKKWRTRFTTRQVEVEEVPRREEIENPVN